VSFRVLTYNIRRGGAGREGPLADVICACRPDLVVVQEATRPRVIQQVAEACGMAEWGALARTSLGFMSARPVRERRWFRPRLSRHAFLEILPDGVDFRVFGVHLSAVHAAWTERRRTIELRSLLRAIERHQSGMHLLTGDFNTLAPGEYLDVRSLPHRLRALVWLSGGSIRWRTIQLVIDAGYVDGYRCAHAGDPGFTFPVWAPHVRLDYAFLPATYAHRLRSVDIVRHPATSTASDHFPLLAEISEDEGQGGADL
jgi:endonuclease/exonuclease/phosphatase family metal-dependent hydrolase